MRLHKTLFVAVLLAAAAFSASLARAEQRIALIIGNDHYANLPKLEKAVADAEGYAEVLRSKGFDRVILRTDLTRAATDEAIAEFLAQIRPGDVAVFAYSGHGWSDGTQNYIVGTDAPAAGSQELLGLISIPLKNGVNGVIDKMDEKGATLKVAIIDACRDNPFTGSHTRGVNLTRGLVRIDPPSGTFVVFSAGAGQTALDRLSDDDADPNSVFSRVFVPALRADLTLQEAVKLTQAKVVDLSKSINHEQRPAYYDEVIGSACLSSKCGPQPPADVAIAKPDAGDGHEIVFWNSIANSNDPADFAAYLKKFPNGVFADIARNRVTKLSIAAVPSSGGPLPKPAAKPIATAAPAPDADSSAATPSSVADAEASPAPATTGVDASEADAGKAGVPDKPPQPVIRPSAPTEDPPVVDATPAARPAAVEPAKPAPLKQAIETPRMEPSAELPAKGDPQEVQLAALEVPKAPSTATVAAAACDRLAADPDDTGKPAGVTGAYLDKLDARQAVPACQDAVEALPTVGRLSYQLGRALEAGKQYHDAERAYEKSAALGYARAMNSIGELYDDNGGLPKDYSVARSWYQKAASAGDFGGMTNMGWLYQNGRGVKKNYTEARLLYEKGAAAGCTEGMVDLAIFYHKGMGGLPRDYAKALYWYEKAAERSSPEAMVNIGLLYEYGLGVPKSRDQAQSWYEKAAALGSEDAKKKLSASAK